MLCKSRVVQDLSQQSSSSDEESDRCVNRVALQDDPSAGFGRTIKALRVLLDNEDNLLDVRAAAFFFFERLTCRGIGVSRCFVGLSRG